MEFIDAVVVGAGVVGLAVARALAQAGLGVALLEREDQVGTGTSSRNSGVIHAGLYYTPGSLKARCCVRGRDLLYAFCAAHAVPHRRCGKLIVAAAPEGAPALAALRAQAAANGVALEMLEASQVRALEPEIACAAALYSPVTGIVDPAALMSALLADAERLGAAWLPGSEVLAIEPHPGGHRLFIAGTGEAVGARWVINCAGHGAPALARRTGGIPPAQVPQAWVLKGNYFALAGRAPFSHLVYPLPEKQFLGIHLTLDLDGGARFGPDTEWTRTPDYDVDPARAALFYPAIRRYWPALPDGALRPAYAGLRPRISGPDEGPVDFRIDGPASHGVPGIVNLYGIESPGLTSALALAEQVLGIVQGASGA